MVRALKILAVQPGSPSGPPEAALGRVEELIRAAVREHTPDLVVLPAALTVGNQSPAAVPTAVRPIDGAPLQLLRLLSRELRVAVAAGFHARRGGDVYSTYALVESDGCTHLSNGSSLLPEEARYCASGRGDGFTRVDGLPVGVLTGLEWAETAPVRLAGKVRLALGGMSWPTTGSLSRMAKVWTGSDDPDRLDAYLRSLPLWQTRLLGVPAVQAVHGSSKAAPGIGATQIVDADGTVLAALPARDGEGYVAATVTLKNQHRPPQALAGRWIGHGPNRVAHEVAMRREALVYQRHRLGGRHSWQSWPAGDLPDEQGPAPAYAHAQATTFDWKAV